MNNEKGKREGVALLFVYVGSSITELLKDSFAIKPSNTNGKAENNLCHRAKIENLKKVP